MDFTLPDYLLIPPERLGHGQPVGGRVVADANALARDMARAIADAVAHAQAEGRPATLLLPVGPVGQYPLLAERINRKRIDCRDAVFVNLDEYLDDEDDWVPEEHPLSCRGFMEKHFYALLDPALAPPSEHRVFPDPADPGAIGDLLEDRGGADVCFAGLGINGHVGLNEPPRPGEAVSVEAFAALPTRAVNLTCETRTITAVTVGGELSLVPRRAVTVGMKEILAARQMRIYCNRPWQRAVVRRALHGPLSPACPASLLRLHLDAVLTVTDEVAALPDVRLR